MNAQLNTNKKIQTFQQVVKIMRSAITFYFKEIYPTFDKFQAFLTNQKVVDLSDAENLTFAQYIYKILFRRYHNSNIQFDTIEDFECELANVLEDNFAKYKRQVKLAKQMQQLTDNDILTISKALANQSNNPNTKATDPTQPLEYISAQAFTIATDNKLQGYLRALQNIPTQLIDAMLLRCVNLFKTIIPNQVYVYGDKKE